MEAQEKGDVTMREYLDMQIGYVNRELGHVREKIAHEKELNTESAKALVKALELQAEKYEQRLIALNHEAQRLGLMIPRIEFEVVTNQLKKDNDVLGDQIKIIQLWISNTEGKNARSQIIAVAALVVSVIALIWSFFIKK